MAPRSKIKRLILVRHAHRDKPFGRAADNGLSEKGKKQTKRSTKFLLERIKDRDVELVSSPKVRCVETLLPLSKKLKKAIDLSPLLLEETESEKELAERVKQFMEDWKKSNRETTIACSHGDWIPLLLQAQFGLEVEVKKGGWAEIELQQGKPKLTWIVQSAKGADL